jgi:phosphatidylserine decarboxylase
MSALKTVIHPINKEGYIFIAIAAIITIIFFLFSEFLGFIGIILTAWVAFFFRDPERVTPEGDNLFISPADGTVLSVNEASPPVELNMENDKYMRICVFLNVMNVHINRIPMSGKITQLHYHPGKFLSANVDKASSENERQSAVMETKSGHTIAFIQIAGLVARRIICNLRDDQEVIAGERYGLIRFGSRADIYIPIDSEVKVSIGQTMVGGETVLAELSSKE